MLHRIYRLEFNAGLSFDKPSVFKTHYLGRDIFKHISIVYEQMLLSKAIRFSKGLVNLYCTVLSLTLSRAHEVLLGDNWL